MKRPRLGKLWDAWGETSYFLTTKLVLLVVWIVGFVLMVGFLNDLERDTTTITNSTFAILGSLAALSFSASRAIQEPKEDSDRILYSGERFLHGAILVLTASIIKYGYLSAAPFLPNWLPPPLPKIVGVAVGTPVPILFFFALNSAHGGLLVLNGILWHRLRRHPEWNRFF